jgi:hypothetical protein
MSERDQLLPDSVDGIGVYLRMQWNATGAAEKFTAVSKRPIRHNRTIERAALWHVLALDEDCAGIVEVKPWSRGVNRWSELVRPKTGIAKSRYEAEAAIRTVPHLLPFSREESEILHRNLGDGHDLSNFLFEHGIGDMKLGQLALCERWHSWLWTEGSERAQSRSIESEILEMACTQLSVALGDVIARYQLEHPIF